MIPMPLGEEWEGSLTGRALLLMQSLDFFIAEYPRTARRLITQMRDVHPLIFEEFNKHSSDKVIPPWMERLKQGQDIGYLSEAGLPGIADPGRRLVAAAHARRIPVEPVPGASAILLALVGSGLSGQQFQFHGYLPPQKSERQQALKQLAARAKREKVTQIFMETPYRNEAMIESALTALPPQTPFTIAANLTQSDQYLLTLAVSDWKKEQRPNLHKIPAVFLIG